MPRVSQSPDDREGGFGLGAVVARAARFRRVILFNTGYDIFSNDLLPNFFLGIILAPHPLIIVIKINDSGDKFDQMSRKNRVGVKTNGI